MTKLTSKGILCLLMGVLTILMLGFPENQDSFSTNYSGFESPKPGVDFPDEYVGDWDTPQQYDKYDGRYFKRHIRTNDSVFEIDDRNSQLYVYGYIYFRSTDPYSMSFQIMVVNDNNDAIVFYNIFPLSSSYVEEEYDLKAVDLPQGTYRVIIDANTRFTVKPFIKSDMVKYKLEFWGIILGILSGVIGIPVAICKISTQQTQKTKVPKKKAKRKQDPLSEVQTSLAAMLGGDPLVQTSTGVACPFCGHQSALGQIFCGKCGKKL